MNVEYLKKYAISAGQTSWDKSSLRHSIQTCEGMHWQRCLSLHLK